MRLNKTAPANPRATGPDTLRDLPGGMSDRDMDVVGRAKGRLPRLSRTPKR